MILFLTFLPLKNSMKLRTSQRLQQIRLLKKLLREPISNATNATDTETLSEEQDGEEEQPLQVQKLI